MKRQKNSENGIVNSNSNFFVCKLNFPLLLTMQQTDNKIQSIGIFNNIFSPSKWITCFVFRIFVISFFGSAVNRRKTSECWKTQHQFLSQKLKNECCSFYGYTSSRLGPSNNGIVINRFHSIRWLLIFSIFSDAMNGQMFQKNRNHQLYFSAQKLIIDFSSFIDKATSRQKTSKYGNQ